MRITRRSALLGLTTAFTLGRASLALASAPTNKRFVVVILRGAMDGLAAVTPYGDPALARLRPELVPPGPEQEGGLLDLGGFFGLHPALVAMHAMYAAGELMPVHAVAGPYRSRSHFEAQDMMESGAEARMTSGWLNRAVAAIPGAGPANLALSVGVGTPLLLRGAAPVGAYAPQSFNRPQAELYAKLLALHGTDPVTGPALRQGLAERGFTAAQLAGSSPAPGTDRNGFPALAATAGRLLAAPDGPRVAALELGGWDTHQGQPQRMVGPLRQLDAGLDALRVALGPAWTDTVVMTMTEFGRTVRSNGTRGTDHGTGSVAFVAGGAVAGGRVLADWPGLGAGRLLENRDLQPTTDLRALAKGLLARQFGLDAGALSRVFPGGDGVAAATRLMRA